MFRLILTIFAIYFMALEAQPGRPRATDHHHGMPDYDIPLFLVNATKTAREQYFDFIRSDNLTKADVESRLDAWAQAQGDEILQAHNVYKELMEMRRAEVNKRFDELLNNVSSVAKELREIRNDKLQTKSEEREKIMAVLQSIPRKVLHLLKQVEKAADEHHKRSAFGWHNSDFEERPLFGGRFGRGHHQY